MSTTTFSTQDGDQRPTDTPVAHTPVALIAFAWTLVGVPLAYGLIRTIQTASSLFTG
jgi:hypothetical protein